MPDRLRGVVSGIFEAEREIITVGDTTYVFDPENGIWEVAQDSLLSIPSLALFASIGATGLADPILVGVENVSGVETYHIFFDGTSAKADYWIDVDGFLIRKISVSGELSAGDLNVPFLQGLDPSFRAIVDLEVSLSGHGMPIVIEAPEIP